MAPISLTVNYARNLYDTEMFGTMDPYCIVQMGSSKFKSKVCKNAGKNPTWNETTAFVYNGEKEMSFQLYDKDTFTEDDFIGSATMSMDAVKQSPGATWAGDLQLYRTGGKVAGNLNIRVDMSQTIGPAMGLPQMAGGHPHMGSISQTVPGMPQAVMAHPMQQQAMTGFTPGMVMQQPMAAGQAQVFQGHVMQGQTVHGQVVHGQVVHAGQPQAAYAQPAYQQQGYQQAAYQQPNIPIAGPPVDLSGGAAGQQLIYASMGGGKMKKDKKEKKGKKDKKKKKKMKAGAMGLGAGAIGGYLLSSSFRGGSSSSSSFSSSSDSS